MAAPIHADTGDRCIGTVDIALITWLPRPVWVAISSITAETTGCLRAGKDDRAVARLTREGPPPA